MSSLNKKLVVGISSSSTIIVIILVLFLFMPSETILNEMEFSEQEIIRAYILGKCNIHELDNEVNIFESGAANSLFAIELMLFIEEKFTVKVVGADLNIDNFCSIDAIACFVESKRAAGECAC